MLIPVIMSGGVGSRLWPASREAHPKPFMILPDGDNLIRKTLRRAEVQSGDYLGEDDIVRFQDIYGRADA
tara:strand:+ start:372 stop:581 length:210 start_codon:yes stop_codon:yes gene_type:complete